MHFPTAHHAFVRHPEYNATIEQAYQSYLGDFILSGDINPHADAMRARFGRYAYLVHLAKAFICVPVSIMAIGMPTIMAYQQAQRELLRWRRVESVYQCAMKCLNDMGVAQVSRLELDNAVLSASYRFYEHKRQLLSEATPQSSRYHVLISDTYKVAQPQVLPFLGLVSALEVQHAHDEADTLISHVGDYLDEHAQCAQQYLHTLPVPLKKIQYCQNKATEWANQHVIQNDASSWKPEPLASIPPQFPQKTLEHGRLPSLKYWSYQWLPRHLRPPHLQTL